MFVSLKRSTVDPTQNEDGDSGYSLGCIWYNSSSYTHWICDDNSNGAAVWTQISGGGAKFGSETDYTEFESDGTMVMVGDATTYDDVYPSSVSTAVGASNPSFTAYNGNLKAYEFVGATNMKEIHIGFQIPHTYKHGTTISPHIHLYIPANSSEVTAYTIKFGLEYTWANIDQTGSIGTNTVYGTRTVAAADPIQNNAILEFTEIAGTSPTKTMSSIIMCRLFRDPTDPSDDFAQSVWLKSADLHIEQDTLGSNEEYTK